jgi:hypothetical protein
MLLASAFFPGYEDFVPNVPTCHFERRLPSAAAVWRNEGSQRRELLALSAAEGSARFRTLDRFLISERTRRGSGDIAPDYIQ